MLIGHRPIRINCDARFSSARLQFDIEKICIIRLTIGFTRSTCPGTFTRPRKPGWLGPGGSGLVSSIFMRFRTCLVRAKKIRRSNVSRGLFAIFKSRYSFYCPCLKDIATGSGFGPPFLAAAKHFWNGVTSGQCGISPRQLLETVATNITNSYTTAQSIRTLVESLGTHLDKFHPGRLNFSTLIRI